MKKNYIVFCVVFFAFLLGLGVWTAASEQSPFSDQENRQLKTSSGISGDVMSGEFQSDLEDMLSDQFPLRYLCVALQTRLKLAVGRQDVGGAYIAGDRLIQRITENEVSYEDIASHAARYARAGERAGVPVTAMPIPSAEITLSDLLPYGAETYDYERAAGAVAAGIKDATILPAAVIDYYRTDHHWTASGAYAAYAAFCASHGIEEIPYADFEVTEIARDFYGSLWSKAPGAPVEPDVIYAPDLPDGVTVTADGKAISFYDADAVKGKDKYRVFQGGNHGVTVIENPGADGTLLIVKDSFVNSLVPYLIRHYGRIVMIDERYAIVDIAQTAIGYEADEIAVIKEAASF